MTRSYSIAMATVVMPISLLAFHSAVSVNLNCPNVMCLEPCPQGEYLALNDQGCETCDCYNPCETFECSTGECHWRLDRQTDRPAPFCVECSGGRQWSDCGGGVQCIATCSNTMPMCPRDCYEGCYCPPQTPVWHHDICITAEQCKDQCDGDQQWTDCGTEITRTCSSDPDVDTTGGACIPRCQCPSDRPVWDENRQLCVNADQCGTNWKRLIKIVE